MAVANLDGASKIDIAKNDHQTKLAILLQYFKSTEFPITFQYTENVGVKAGKDIVGDVRSLVAPLSGQTEGPGHIFPSPNQKFTGRSAKIKEIHEAIENCKGKSHWYERVVVIHGFGGMGKTEIAKVIANDCRKTVDYIKWFDATSENTMMEYFLSLANSLDMRFDSNIDCQNIYRQLHLKYNSGLFIFDNAEALETIANTNEQGVKKFLPIEYQCEHPVIIITSRNGLTSWGGTKENLKMLSLQELDPKDAYDCLVKYFELEKHAMSDPVQTLIKQLAKDVEGYPLSLSIIGSFLADETDSCSLSETAARLEAKINFLAGKTAKELTRDSKAENQLIQICRETIEKVILKTKGKVAKEILTIVAFMNPEVMLYVGEIHSIHSMTWWDMYAYPGNRIPVHELDNDFRSGLNLLKTSSLITISQGPNWKRDIHDVIDIHGLVQKCCLNEFCANEIQVDVIDKIIHYQGFSTVNTIESQFFTSLFEKTQSSKTLQQNDNFGIFLHCYLLLSEEWSRKG